MAERNNKASSRLFYLKGAAPEGKKSCHDIAYAYVCMHICTFFAGDFFFSLAFLFSFSTSVETALNNELVQVE